MRPLIISLCLLAFPAICSAEIYKWVDERGQVGYADDLGKVPKKYRDKALTTEKEEQAVEIVEKTVTEKTAPKGAEKKDSPAEAKEKAKEKPLYAGKDGAAWKQDFGRQKHEIKSLEEQLAGIKERMTDGSKVSRGEYLTLQNTQRDLDIRITKAKKKLDSLTEAADRAEVPAEFR